MFGLAVMTAVCAANCNRKAAFTPNIYPPLILSGAIRNTAIAGTGAFSSKSNRG
jgi:hypothetical protein